VGEHSLGAAPRLKRVVQMAAKASSPHRATPLHVLVDARRGRRRRLSDPGRA
jgi:hypothetical protein